jgi:tetratricopeptide (TPR) repeat protein
MPQTVRDALTTALEHHQAGRTAEAEQIYTQILAQEPAHAGVWHCLGVLCLQSGRAAEAIELIGRAVAIEPNNGEFYNHLGAAYGALERHDEAVTSLRRAVQIAPGSATAHYNLGTALRNAGRLNDAVVSFRHAIAADPNSAEAHYNLANTLRELKLLAEAEASFREALRVRPAYVKACINLGNVLRDLERTDEAIEMLRTAVALAPNYAAAHLNLGTTLRDAGHFTEAVECLRTAVALDGNLAEAHNNLGTALQALAQFSEAGACYDQALRCDPQLADAHFSRATFRIRQGDLESGFAEYEWRWKCSNFSDRGFSQPRWDGSPLQGRTILLYAEQGLGDTMHFVRYAATARERGGRVIVECQPPLLKILALCPFIERLIALYSPLPHFDVHAPLMSLPDILKLPPDQWYPGPYLSADPQLVDAWRATLAKYAGFRVGICWQGNPKYLFNAQRSFPLSSFAPVAQIPGVRLVSLQKEAAADEIATAGFEVIDLGSQFDEAAGPFMDSAAVMKSLDLVITSDTAIAHLAGGLGVPVWLPLSAHGDWRWLTDRQDTPWYPTMRLFRQQRLDHWDDVFARIADELRLRC